MMIYSPRCFTLRPVHRSQVPFIDLPNLEATGRNAEGMEHFVFCQLSIQLFIIQMFTHISLALRSVTFCSVGGKVLCQESDEKSILSVLKIESACHLVFCIREGFANKMIPNHILQVIFEFEIFCKFGFYRTCHI